MRTRSSNGSMPTSPSKERLYERARDWVSPAAIFVVLVVLTIYPLGSLLLQTIFPHLFDPLPSLGLSAGPLVQTFIDSSNLVAVLNSASVGLSASVLAVILGTLTAYGVRRAHGRWLRVVLSTSVWLIFFSPSYVLAEGWILLMQDNGILAQLFHLPNGWSGWFFTRPGLVLVMGLRYFPFVHLAMVPAIGNVGEDLFDAGRLLGASRGRIFQKIALPLLAPAWLAGASIAFAEGFGDFGFAAAITPQTHIPLLSYQIYAALSQAPVNYSAAAGLSLLVVLVTAGALWLQLWWLRRRGAYETLSGRSRIGGYATSRGRPSPATLASLVLAAIALLLPLGATLWVSLFKSLSGGLGLSNLTLANYGEALVAGGGVQPLFRSLEYALVAAVLTALLAVLVGYQLVFRGSAVNRVLNLIVISTIAIPGVVMAAGFVFAWNAVWLIPLHLVLYGTPICLAMAYISGALPYAVRLQMGAMSQISPNLPIAARVLGAGQRTVLSKIILPLVSATAVSIFFLSFTNVVFELPASSLLYPAGSPPLPVAIQAKFNAFEWTQGAALTVMGMLVILGVYGAGSYLAYWIEKRRHAALMPLPAGGSSEPEAVVEDRKPSVARL